MALIECPECWTQVSDKADKCPKCACPISITPKTEQTIELTSKRFKKQQIFAFLCLVVGVIMTLSIGNGANWSAGLAVVSSLLVAGGIIWLIIVRIKIRRNNR